MINHKYKAWDKENKRWLNLWQILISSDGDVMAVKDIGGEQYGLHQVELVESTGLHDRNRKEIYNGDIAKHVCWSSKKACPNCGFQENKKDDIGVIEFSNRYYPDEYPSHSIARFEWVIDGFHDALERTEEFLEIIGNVYENPELMKGGV